MNCVLRGWKHAKIQDTWAQAPDENKVAEISVASNEQPAATLSLTQDILVGGGTEPHLRSANCVVPERGEESHRDSVNVLIEEKLQAGIGVRSMSSAATSAAA